MFILKDRHKRYTLNWFWLTSQIQWFNYHRNELVCLVCEQNFASKNVREKIICRKILHESEQKFNESNESFSIRMKTEKFHQSLAQNLILINLNFLERKFFIFLREWNTNRGVLLLITSPWWFTFTVGFKSDITLSRLKPNKTFNVSEWRKSAKQKIDTWNFSEKVFELNLVKSRLEHRIN